LCGDKNHQSLRVSYLKRLEALRHVVCYTNLEWGAGGRADEIHPAMSIGIYDRPAASDGQIMVSRCRDVHG
jgi:hypothetical protein